MCVSRREDDYELIVNVVDIPMSPAKRTDDLSNK